MESNQEMPTPPETSIAPKLKQMTRFFAIEQVENSDIYVLHAGKLDAQAACPYAPNQVGMDDKGRQFFYRPPCNTSCPLATLLTSDDGKTGQYLMGCGNGDIFQEVEILQKTKIIAETKKGLILPST